MNIYRIKGSLAVIEPFLRLIEFEILSRTDLAACLVLCTWIAFIKCDLQTEADLFLNSYFQMSSLTQKVTQVFLPECRWQHTLAEFDWKVALSGIRSFRCSRIVRVPAHGAILF